MRVPRAMRSRWLSAFVAGILFVSVTRLVQFHGQCGHPLVTDPPLRCTFDYSGPLDPRDINCLLDTFPFTTPVRLLPTLNVSGIPGTATEAPIPIFIPFKDRLSVLIETIRSYHRHIQTPFEIVIFNDNTTYAPAVNFLHRLSESGVLVHTNDQKWTAFAELYQTLTQFIDRYMDASKSGYFVLSDPDCALDSAPGNILHVYQHALTALNLSCCGAAIRNNDWAPEVWNADVFHIQHIEHVHARSPAKHFEFEGRNYFYIEADADTTFALYPKGRPIQRPGGRDRPSIKMLAPLAIRHLDFYLDPRNPPEDYTYYLQHIPSKGVNHMDHITTENNTSEAANHVLKASVDTLQQEKDALKQQLEPAQEEEAEAKQKLDDVIRSML